MTSSKRVLVTGGGTFLGDNIAAALVAEGAEVTLLVRPGAEDRLGPLKDRVRWWTADVWDPASLRGRARGHACVVNTVGSLVDDPAHGLTHHRLNFVSARNVVNMCISDGVPNIVLLSSARAPWMSSHYIRAKREAENYVERVGVSCTVIRAPLVYVRGAPRPLFYEFVTLLGRIPPFAWTGVGSAAPMPIDMLARAAARIALNPRRDKRIYRARDLRRLNSREEARRAPQKTEVVEEDTKPRRVAQVEDDAPFGWTPPRR